MSYCFFLSTLIIRKYSSTWVFILQDVIAKGLFSVIGMYVLDSEIKNAEYWNH